MADLDTVTAESDIGEGSVAKESQRLVDVHDEAMKRFDSVAPAQIDLRRASLEARRFVTIPGAMWEGDWFDPDLQAPKPEVDKISKSLNKIHNDYRQNRMMVDYRAVDDKADADTAKFVDGVYRADNHHFKSDQARDNGFDEGLKGGFGAWRLATDWTDPYDKDDDTQRVNPGIPITDADQCVYFDPASKLYDKSDAGWAFVIHMDPRATAVDKWGEENIADWPLTGWGWTWDWYRIDTVQTAEYYVVEDKSEELVIFSNDVTGEEQRYYKSELQDGFSADMKAEGWKRKTRDVKRRRVRRYIMNGTKVLKDEGYIAGDRIPIVPFYGNRSFVDGMERWWGHVQKRMDSARIHNSVLSKILDVAGSSAADIPILDPERVPPGYMQDTWTERNTKRPAYLAANPQLDQDGKVISIDVPVLKAPDVPAPLIALIQLTSADLAEDNDDAERIKANVSAEAMELAAQRVDDRSASYLDNLRQSIEAEGEIYLCMAKEVYVEPGRKVETMTVDADTSLETIAEPIMDKGNVFRIRNDLSKGRYKVIASVQEATATKRDKAAKRSLSLAEVAIKAGDNEMAGVALLTAIDNSDGEGIEKLKEWSHKKALTLGLDKPTPEEQREIEQTTQNQRPDPAQEALMAQAARLQGQAKESEAKVVETLASAKLKQAQADAVGAPEPVPDTPSGDVPTGFEHHQAAAEVAEKVASAKLKTAQANEIDRRPVIRKGSEVE